MEAETVLAAFQGAGLARGPLLEMNTHSVSEVGTSESPYKDLEWFLPSLLLH